MRETFIVRPLYPWRRHPCELGALLRVDFWADTPDGSRPTASKVSGTARAVRCYKTAARAVRCYKTSGVTARAVRSFIATSLFGGSIARRLVLMLAALTVLSASCHRDSLAAEPARPNILYFYVDDMGWGSIGPNGQWEREAKGLPYVRTPNLDQLARSGVNFRRGYGCTVCSPARSSQQLGFHQGHTFADRNDPDNAKKAMRAEDVTMGDVLSAAGYATGYWGKWGYGGSKDRQNPTLDNIQTLPTSHGYQHVLAELHHVRAHTFFQPTLWHAPAPAGSRGGLHLVPNSMAQYRGDTSYPDAPALQNHPDYPNNAYCDDAYAFAALDFVRTQAQQYNASGQPFFGLLAVQIPHAPFGEIADLPDWDKAYEGDERFGSLSDQTRQWSAMVTRIDAHFGNILDALEDPNHDGDTSDSVANETLVVFQSDNGGPRGKNNVELDANGGLRDNKGSIYEGGIRVPLVMRWPDKITADSTLKQGTTNDRIVDVTDLMPTFCELAGAKIPLGVDGVSIAPTLTGDGHQRQREFVIHEAGKRQSIIRGNHKLVRSDKGPLELYDLYADHGEQNNIASEHPKLVKELETLLLDQQVTEPRGFANTYHHFTGGDGDTISDAENWSDYRYENAGVTYMSDDGPPRSSWVARVASEQGEAKEAQADQSLEFLALEIAGDPASGAKQTLVLGNEIDLTGRNEVRVSAGGTLTVDQGTVTSQRWIDIRPGGELSGTGTVDAEVFNSGTVLVTGDASSHLRFLQDYRQATDGKIEIALTGAEEPPIRVGGTAALAGQLVIDSAVDSRPAAGQSITILSAGQVAGSFANTDDVVVASNGVVFKIAYSNSQVTLEAQ